LDNKEEKEKEKEKKRRKKKRRKKKDLLLRSLSRFHIKEINVSKSLGAAGIPVLHDAHLFNATVVSKG